MLELSLGKIRGDQIVRHLSTTLAIAATAIGFSLPARAEDSHQQKLMAFARTLATNLSQACPHKTGNYGNTEAFKLCADALRTATFLPFADAILWGGRSVQPADQEASPHPL